MQTVRKLATWTLGSLTLMATCLNSQSQTLDTWIGASGGEWNTAANWSAANPPLDSTMDAFIGTGTTVNYNLPMQASSFGNLTNNGVLNINANGFNAGSIVMLLPGGGNRLFVNTGGNVTVSGSLMMNTNAAASLAPGGYLNVGSLTLDSTSSHASGPCGSLTNNGGTFLANSTSINPGSGTGIGLVLINGGVNNLGNVSVGRANSSSGFAALGSEGLVISNGIVAMTNLNVGNSGAASYLTTQIAGGIVTNYGNVLINQATAGRISRLLQMGGLFVVPDPGVINPNSTASATAISVFSVLGGTNIAGGLSLGDTGGAASVVRFTNAASIFIGSAGIVWNNSATLTAALNGTGLFGATADWTGSAPMLLNGGTFTFQAADPAGVPHNITLTGALTGNGGLTKTGNGILTLNAADTYSGNTYVKTGTLALGGSASLASPQIIVGSGATLDVTALSGGLTLNANQTLSGFGAVAGGVIASASSTIMPGSNSVTGTLTLNGGLTENGSAVNQFNLSSNPSGPGNDLLNVPGGLNVSGVNTILVNGALQSGGVYPLISYAGGAFNGSLANFLLSGSSGALSNSATAQTIYFIAPVIIRTPTNLTWIGNAITNNWDTEISTNWLNLGTAKLDFTVPGDFVLFSDLGAGNPLVTIANGVSVAPGSITVNTASNYTILGGGTIGGVGGLTISNGTLTVLTTNTFSGVTILDGGTLATPVLANSGSPSAIGQTSSDPGNLVFNGGSLDYFGLTGATDHGITLAGGGGAIAVTNGGDLTLNGPIVGSGALTNVGPGSVDFYGANSYTNATTLTGGTLNLNGVSTMGTGPVIFAGGALSIASSSSQQFYANAINVVSTGTLTVNGGNADNIFSGQWAGPGTLTLNISNNSADEPTFNGDMTTNFTGTLLIADTSVGILRFNSGGSSSGAQQCTGTPTALFDLGNGSVTVLNRNGGGSSYGNYYFGALSGGVSTSLKGSANASSSSTYNIGAKNLSTTFAGIIANGSGGTGATVGITKVGAATLTLLGQNTYTGDTTVSNGVLALAFNPTNGADGSIDQSVNINILPGGLLDVSGRSDTTLQLGNNTAQTLKGRGVLNGNLYVGGYGVVAPGGGAGGNTGILTVTNAITLTGTAWMKLNRGASPTSDELVSTHSTITYGGTLVITNIGPRLQAGDTFTLFSGAGLSSSSFGYISLPNYYTWDTTKLGVNGSITVTGVLPPPMLTNVDFSALQSGTITLNAVNGVPNAPVNILSTTNLALPLSSWTNILSTTFDYAGNLNTSITVDATLPQNYFLLQSY